ncbi:myocardin-related transcription factor A-like isoform X2 [Acanthochromis polyacanthus]|uniref:myocardin-related transcription factor A-like isoform X2 n=1 Tax=Acanthochromis polyacanthus TaxID=80966 RepID=UPI0022340C5D|nr:myocardin-related transcription factor A-like isoform X2 [Acanthochromis polyacanthus]
MLQHLPCVRIDPFKPQPISSSMEERAIRFELERQACQSLRQVLQLKLQQRRTREELVSQGIMPPLKSSASFHEQRRSLERARTEDYLKRKIRSRPERSELIRMHILEETLAEPSLQAKQLQLKRARLADNLNDKIAQRPGPMELIHKNILPVHSSIRQAIIASRENSSCDEDSNDSLSPGPPGSQDCLPGLRTSPAETLAGGSFPSPTQVPPAAPLPPISGSSVPLKLTNGTAASSVQRAGTNSHIKPKPKSDHSAQRHKKAKDSKPKIRKLKYHQYIPPDQKGDKEPPPHLDSSYAKILQQQQLFLQLQILSQQQQHYHTILPAPPRPQTDQPPPPSSSSSSSSSPPGPPAAPPALPPNHRNSAPLSGIKPASLPPNLEELKVAELKSELKLRSLPVSGTKNDLIERLRTYQDLNGGGDSTSCPPAGGATAPGAEGAGRASENNNTSQQQPQQQLQSHQTPLNDAGNTTTLNAATPQQHLLTLSPVSLTPCDHAVSPISPNSPEDSSFHSDPLGELMSPPLDQLSLQPSPAAQLHTSIKEETSCSSSAPCQFSLKSSSLQKLCSVPSGSSTSTTTAPGVDKDRMLQEKDRQIEELLRKLRQKQRLVDVLKMQLEHGSREGHGPEPQVLLRVKEEPPDKPSVALSTGRPPFPPQASHEMDVTMVTVKQEVIEEGEAAAVQPQHTNALLQEQIQLHPEQKSSQNKPVCLQQLAQHQAIQKLLLQQHNLHNHNQMLENQQNMQKLCQHRRKKSPKPQQQKQAVHSPQHQQQKHLQQVQLKQQILLKQQKSLFQQQLKQQQTKHLQQIQIQTKIQLKQQQVLVQQKQPPQPQVPPAPLHQSGSTPSFSMDLLKTDSTPTLVTDGNGNHFLIALTNHKAGNQKPETCEGKTSNHITLQRLQSTPARLPGLRPVQLTRADGKTKQSSNLGLLKQQNTKMQNGSLQVSVEKPQQEAAQSSAAPPSLQPFFKDQERNSSSPSSQTELCPGLDVFFSPPASIQTPASSPDDKDSEHEDDFIDIILQTGDMSSTFTPTPDPFLDHLSPDFSAFSPPPSPLQLLLSPPVPPSCGTLQPASSELLANTIEEEEHPMEAGSGRLEDFLQSTMGKPLLGVEPGGLLTLIDDLHSQMLCTPSILDYPPSPMDTFNVASEEEPGLDGMDWLDFTSGGKKDEEPPTLAPLVPQTPPSVFSTDFLDSYDLQIHLDSCL